MIDSQKMEYCRVDDHGVGCTSPGDAWTGVRCWRDRGCDPWLRGDGRGSLVGLDLIHSCSSVARNSSLRK
jgi:hypothetical protein